MAGDNPQDPEIDGSDVELVHERARDLAREVQAKEERAINGLSDDGPALAGGVRSRYSDLGNVGVGGAGGKKGKRAAERAYQDILLMNLQNQLALEIEATLERIEVLEERLVAEFGEDFLEDNARMYLGDDMPERPPGMSDEEWNKLLQDKLADKMLGPDGKPLPQYAHLDIAHWLAEQRRLADLEKQAGHVVKGAERLAEGGLTQDEEATLKAQLQTETLAVLNKSETELKNDTLRKPFKESVVGSSETDSENAGNVEKGTGLLADLGVDLKNA